MGSVQAVTQESSAVLAQQAALVTLPTSDAIMQTPMQMPSASPHIHMPIPGDGSPGPVPSAPATVLHSPREGSHAHPLGSRPLSTL